MPHTQPNYVHNATWDAGPKVESREITIIEFFRFFYELVSIPFQYWTMAGSHTRRGEQIMGEADQLLKKKLILPYQYYGVDREEEIIKCNREVHPELNWIHDDFYEAIRKAILAGTFNPSIINYDGVIQPKYSSQYLKRLLTLLDYNISNEVMLVTNFVLTNPYSRSKKLNFNIEDAIEELNKMYAIPDHWHVYKKSYRYTQSQADMGVLIFLKESHNIHKFTFTRNREIGVMDDYVNKEEIAA